MGREISVKYSVVWDSKELQPLYILSALVKLHLSKSIVFPRAAVERKFDVMAARTSETAFSPNGQYFANVSTDSRLKIWECESGRPKQEFTPASHLSAACTCLVWAPPTKQPEQVKFFVVISYM
jgi:WD40 repeat protein